MNVNISIVIPHKQSVETLSRLIKSIPRREDIEIIVSDNSDEDISNTLLSLGRDIILLNTESSRFAGGARNDGVKAVNGKWIIFADADDFFAEGAFTIFDKYIDTDFDIIYFGCDSVYDDTLAPSDRHLGINSLLSKVKNGIRPEIEARLYVVAPWAKMIKAEFVKKNEFRFDEVIAANDVYFSTLTGINAKTIFIDLSKVYVVTTRKGSLSNRWNKPILESRYTVGLRRNSLLKKNNLANYQISVMVYLYRALKMDICLFFKFLLLACRYRQNIFIGARNWLTTFKDIININRKNKEYIVNSK